MPKLTTRYIQSLPIPTSGQVILRDDDLVGFGLRVTPSKMTYIAETRLNGTVRRVTIGRADLLPVADARKEARRVLALMSTGKHPQEPSATVTLGEVLHEYVNQQNLRPSTSSGYLKRTRRYFADWLTNPIKDITGSMVLASSLQPSSGRSL